MARRRRGYRTRNSKKRGFKKRGRRIPRYGSSRGGIRL